MAQTVIIGCIEVGRLNVGQPKVATQCKSAPLIEGDPCGVNIYINWPFCPLLEQLI